MIMITMVMIVMVEMIILEIVIMFYQYHKNCHYHCYYRRIANIVIVTMNIITITIVIPIT